MWPCLGMQVAAGPWVVVPGPHGAAAVTAAMVVDLLGTVGDSRPVVESGKQVLFVPAVGESLAAAGSSWVAAVPGGVKVLLVAVMMDGVFWASLFLERGGFILEFSS